METFLGIELSTWWFAIVGAVFTGYSILDGFDLGAGAIHLLFKKEESRRIALNAIGPVWGGNEVWLVIGGGALFAGFPDVYATIFSSFYIPFMLFLVLLILRAISIEFRSKEPMLWWRKLWDIQYSVSSSLIGFLLGVVLGNLIIGLPINEHFEYTGTFLQLLNPYALLTGATTLSLFAMHGSIYLVMKTEKRLYTKLSLMVQDTSRVFVVFYMLLTIVTLVYYPHMANTIKRYPFLIAVPVVTVFNTINTRRLLESGKYLVGFFSSALTVALLLITFAMNLYPNIVRSTINPLYSLTVHNAASSPRSLTIMLIIAAIGVPIIALYTGYVFWTFKGKVKLEENSY
ncbi:MAG: cytochrome d ubiquinol oxidase subunit II [Sphingobacteriales bacterium]|uniref:cytochrome d ubiquinol oxidase subunit II n=1 Tax=Hydrotalea flava TaxID=714549 RepID=UPI00083765FE|nr:cytochrome d ubiquinol oxidase subunit II [Hydrotalea flava]RTL49862.1 MAG: cytochrome d ubiquinol oxidase subunit II [Sphingobacteriales bacterium]